MSTLKMALLSSIFAVAHGAGFYWQASHMAQESLSDSRDDAERWCHSQGIEIAQSRYHLYFRRQSRYFLHTCIPRDWCRLRELATKELTTHKPAPP